MLKRLTKLLIVTAILGTGFARQIIIIGFEFHQARPSCSYCIINSRLEVLGHGKCYLMKTLKDTGERQGDGQAIGELFITLFLEPMPVHEFDNVFQAEGRGKTDGSDSLYIGKYRLEQWRPPIVKV